MHMQYCQDSLDITGSIYALDDADEFRLWDDAEVLASAEDLGNGEWRASSGGNEYVGSRAACIGWMHRQVGQL